jgi:hypothetical protein
MNSYTDPLVRIHMRFFGSWLIDTPISVSLKSIYFFFFWVHRIRIVQVYWRRKTMAFNHLDSLNEERFCTQQMQLFFFLILCSSDKIKEGKWSARPLITGSDSFFLRYFFFFNGIVLVLETGASFYI